MLFPGIPGNQITSWKLMIFLHFYWMCHPLSMVKCALITIVVAALGSNKANVHYFSNVIIFIQYFKSAGVTECNYRPSVYHYSVASFISEWLICIL